MFSWDGYFFGNDFHILGRMIFLLHCMGSSIADVCDADFGWLWYGHYILKFIRLFYDSFPPGLSHPNLQRSCFKLVLGIDLCSPWSRRFYPTTCFLINCWIFQFFIASEYLITIGFSIKVFFLSFTFRLVELGHSEAVEFSWKRFAQHPEKNNIQTYAQTTTQKRRVVVSPIHPSGRMPARDRKKNPLNYFLNANLSPKSWLWNQSRLHMCFFFERKKNFVC